MLLRLGKDFSGVFESLSGRSMASDRHNPGLLHCLLGKCHHVAAASSRRWPKECAAAVTESQNIGGWQGPEKII